MKVQREAKGDRVKEREEERNGTVSGELKKEKKQMKRTGGKMEATKKKGSEWDRKEPVTGGA